MREEAEPIQLVHIFTEMERWDKFTEAELNYMHKYAHEEKAVVTECMHADDHKHVKYTSSFRSTMNHNWYVQETWRN